MEPCAHAEPQAADQLHGVCIFCYRDRLADSRRDVERMRGLSRALIDRLVERSRQYDEIDDKRGSEVTSAALVTVRATLIDFGIDAALATPADDDKAGVK
jgi:hypothetical protein